MLPFPGADDIEKIIEFDFLHGDVYLDEGIAQDFANLLAVGQALQRIVPVT
jgi:hypothetical protein